MSLPFFEKIFSDPLGAAGAVALGAVKGLGKKKKGQTSAASSAEAATLGFARARAQAEKHKAEDRASKRMHAEQEGRRELTSYEQEVLRVYDKAFRNSNVRKELAQQLSRQGYQNHSLVLGRIDNMADTDPSIKVG